MNDQENIQEQKEIAEWNEEILEDLEPLQEKALVVYSRDWTVETIANQIQQLNIDLNPEFQRRNAWRDNKRSLLIESLIMGLPVPEVVLAEHPNIKKSFLVIDGKQRLLTVAGFLYPDKFRSWDNGGIIETIKKENLEGLPHLNGVSFKDLKSQEQYKDALRQLLNAEIRCTVISNYKSDDVLYNIFYRLNTGSVPLSTQELRQVLNKGSFAKYLYQITDSFQPIHMVMGIEGSDNRFRDIEILLRFFLIYLFGKNYSGNLKNFLDTNMSKVTKEWGAYKPQIEQLYKDFNDSIGRLKKVFGDGNIGKKFTDGKYSRVLNKWLLESQIYYFMFVPDEALLQSTITSFIDAFEKMSSEDFQFRSSLEYSQKDLAQYRVRFQSIRQLVNKLFKLNISHFPLSEKH